MPRRRKLDRGKHQVEMSNGSSDLWDRLPEALTVLILNKLPFSSLLGLCSVSKSWRNLILSPEISFRYTSGLWRLFYFHRRKLVMFNSRSGTWEIVPVQPQLNQFALLNVVASAGGLMCFCTLVFGEFIVWNPLIKCYKRLLMPSFEEASTSSGQTYMGAFPMAGMPPRLLSDLSRSFVGMVLDSKTQRFKLIVAGVFPASQCTALAYDSASDSWKQVSDIPEIDVLDNIKVVESGGNLYFSYDIGLIQNKILKYDVKQEAWSWILVGPTQGPTKIIEQNGKILLISTSHMNSNQFFDSNQIFELEDPESSKWTLAHAKLKPPVRRAMLDITCFQCFGHGDEMFFVQRNFDIRLFLLPSTERLSVRVSFHKLSTNSDVLSNWETWQGEFFPVCQIFKPSTARL